MSKPRSPRSRKIVRKVAPIKREIVKTDEVICSYCRKPSGWDNSILRHLTRDRTLNCKTCGKVAVRFVGKAPSPDDPVFQEYPEVPVIKMTVDEPDTIRMKIPSIPKDDIESELGQMYDPNDLENE